MSHFSNFLGSLEFHNQQIIFVQIFSKSKISRFLAEKLSRVFLLFFFFLFLAPLGADFHVFRSRFVFLK